MMKKWIVKTLIATTLASAPVAPVDGTVGAYNGEEAIVSEVNYEERDSHIVGQMDGRESSSSEEIEISLDF